MQACPRPLQGQKARDAVKAIAASFETVAAPVHLQDLLPGQELVVHTSEALGAIDSAQLTLQKVNSTSV